MSVAPHVEDARFPPTPHYVVVRRLAAGATQGTRGRSFPNHLEQAVLSDGTANVRAAGAAEEAQPGGMGGENNSGENTSPRGLGPKHPQSAPRAFHVAKRKFLVASANAHLAFAPSSMRARSASLAKWRATGAPANMQWPARPPLQTQPGSQTHPAVAAPGSPSSFRNTVFFVLPRS